MKKVISCIMFLGIFFVVIDQIIYVKTIQSSFPAGLLVSSRISKERNKLKKPKKTHYIKMARG